MDQNKINVAVDHFTHSQAIAAAVAAAQPNGSGAQREQAQSLAWLADAEARRGHWDDVERDRREELAIYLALLDKNPKDNNIRQSLPVTYRALAQAALAQGLGDAAESYLAVAEAACEQLRQLDPDNTFWQELSVDTATNHADVLLWLGQLDAAGKELADADDRIGKLLHSDASVLRWRQWQLQVRLLQAQRQLMAGNALSTFSSLAGLSADIDRSLSQHRENRILHTLRMDALALTAQLAQVRGDRAGSDKIAQQMIVEIDAGDPEPHLRFLRAQALALTGRTNEASALASELWQQGYHHPELSTLRQSLTTAKP